MTEGESNEKLVTTFNELYDACIDVNGTVKACGRHVCSKLIHFANQNFSRTSGSYGDESTGYMNVTNLMALHTTLNNG